MKTRTTAFLGAALGAALVGVALGLPAEAADALSRLAAGLLESQADPGVLLAEMALPAATKEKIDDIKSNMQKILDPDDGLMAKVGTIEGRLSNVKEEIEERSLDNAEWVDEVNEAVKEQKIKEVMEEMTEELHERMDELENLGELGGGKSGGSTGQKIADSFKSAYEEASDPVRGNWKADLAGLMLKEITNVSASAGPAITERQQDEIVGSDLREVTIFDLLDSVPVSTDTVDFVRVKAVTDNAGSQPGQGGTVPFSDWTFEEVRKKIETIMMKVRAAQQVLEDEDNFQRLLVTFRATMRGQVAVKRKEALVSIPQGELDGTAPSTGS